ncbi:MAG: flagellar biosynthesis protein FlhB [Thioalkalivibrionaceae bacterium]
MAENENGQEKTEQPTPKRLREAREKGQVARSRELGTLLVLLGGGALLWSASGLIAQQLLDGLEHGLVIERELAFDSTLLLPYLLMMLAKALWLLLPLFGVVVVAALAGPILVGGLDFSSKALMPKLEKLNPLKGLKRIFSAQGLLEFVKTLAKFALVTIVGAVVLWWLSDRLVMLGELPVEKAILEAGQLAALTFILVSASLLLVALIDVPFQLWNHQRQLKMTRQELKDEFKETDGKPEVKQRIRQLQQEIAQRRMMENVAKADVIITNPTHFAVALAYDADTMSAPKLLAKGTDLVAARIRALGEESGVVRVEAPRVARAIYFTTEIGEVIPPGLFVAVAKILAYVFQLRDINTRENAVLEIGALEIPETYLDPQRARRNAWRGEDHDHDSLDGQGEA